jgi:hypothetical protein
MGLGRSKAPGRVRLRPNRGLPACPALRRYPQKSVVRAISKKLQELQDRRPHGRLFALVSSTPDS